MRARPIAFGAISLAAGFGLGLLAPREWEFSPPYGLVLGAGIYILGFRRQSLLMPVLFLALTALILYVRYGMSERVDLTWPLGTAVAWGWADARRWGASVPASRRGGREPPSSA